MFTDTLNSEKTKIEDRGRTIGTFEASFDEVVNKVPYHPENRDHEANYKAQSHHGSCDWCSSKMNITMHFIKDINEWYIGSGNTRDFSFAEFIKKYGKVKLDPRYFTEMFQVTINIFDNIKPSIRALKNSGGTGVSWKSVELDLAAKKLANILPGNTIFEDLGVKSALSSNDRKNLEKAYQDYEVYLVPIFNFLEKMTEKGVDVKHQIRKSKKDKDRSLTLDNVLVFQSGVIRGLINSLKAEVPLDLIRGCMFELAMKNEDHPTSKSILNKLLDQRIKGAQGEAKIKAQADIVLTSLTTLQQVGYSYKAES